MLWSLYVKTFCSIISISITPGLVTSSFKNYLIYCDNKCCFITGIFEKYVSLFNALKNNKFLFPSLYDRDYGKIPMGNTSHWI